MNVLGFQSQIVTDAYRTMVRATWPATLKVIVPGGLDASLLREWRQRRPSGLLVLRHYFPNEDLLPTKYAAILAAADQIADLHPVLEVPINEAHQTDPDDIARLADYSAQFVRLAADQGFKAAVGVFSEGNPSDLGWWPRFYPALRAAREHGGYLALHEYGIPSLGFEDWHLLRHRRVWAVLPDDLKIPLLITECGIDGGIEGRREQGWRSYLDARQYADWLRRYRQELAADAYVHGAHVFLCGGNEQWRRFDITDEVDLRPVFTEPVGGPPLWTPALIPPAPPPTPPPEVHPVSDIDLSDVPVEEMLSSTHFERGRARTTLVVIHATRSGEMGNSISQEANGTAVYMDNDSIPERNRVSSHLVVGNAKVYRVVHDDDTAWHAGYLNDRAIGIEVAQAVPTAPYHPRQYEFAAKATARYCRKYKIPIRRVMNEDEAGIIGHEDSAQGKSYGKSDPGPMWDWPRFVALVQQFAGAAPGPGPVPTPGVFPDGRPVPTTAQYDEKVWARAKRGADEIIAAAADLQNGGDRRSPGDAGDAASLQKIALQAHAAVKVNEKRHGVNR